MTYAPAAHDLRRALRVRAPASRPMRGLDALWADARDAALHRFVFHGSTIRDTRDALALEPSFAHTTDHALDESLAELRPLFRLGRATRAHRVRAVAALREVARRETGLLPHAGQIRAAFAMLRGRVAEVATGEGKTLAATMPGAIFAWRARGCHVVTANDYLAQRDAAWMKPVYARCGLRTAHISQDTPYDARRAAYRADIVYLTGKEAAADFLRDRLLAGRRARADRAAIDALCGCERPALHGLVMRGLAHAIVDEADAVLIDDAVTPLIIAGDRSDCAGRISDAHDLAAAHAQAAPVVEAMREGAHYRLDRARADVELTEAGRAHIDDLGATLGGLWRSPRRREEIVTQAVAARAFYFRGERYVVHDGRIVIIDESIGRLTPDRTWREGMHQAVEAKEGLAPTTPHDTLARVSFQRFFRLYGTLCGMTGTAHEARRELWRVYRLAVERVPTHKPCGRTVLPTRAFRREEDKLHAIIAETRDVREQGRPVLIGVRSVKDSVRLSALLDDAGIPHELLNAERHAEEARVIARAGAIGRVTVATSMAGRGTDIVLGEGVAAAGGLHVVAAERLGSSRLDRQLFGRCARQGDPGSVRVFVSLEDDAIARRAPLLAAALRRFSGERAGAPRAVAALSRYVQRRSERAAKRRRADVLRADDWLEERLGFAWADGW